MKKKLSFFYLSEYTIYAERSMTSRTAQLMREDIVGTALAE